MADLLASCDYILAEDTRNTKKLLNFLKLNKKLVSFHEHSSKERIDEVIFDLKGDRDICYVSDAGTPNLSDPGGKLSEAALSEGIKVCPIPGPSALTALISVAPFSCSQFVFMGFFPKKKGRETMVENIKKIENPVFFFESCHRIKKTLCFLSERLPAHNILIGRELTKKFEQINYLPLSGQSITKNLVEKGEFVFALVKQAKV